VLHISPESSIGGNLALVHDGDIIELDVENRKLNLMLSDDELKRRKSAWIQPKAHTDRGYVKIYLDHVQQAELGADFDILVGGSGDIVKGDLH
jgi:dihydroxy-acid dehydratase